MRIKRIITNDEEQSKISFYAMNYNFYVYLYFYNIYV